MCCTTCELYASCDRNEDAISQNAYPGKGCCSKCIHFEPSVEPDEKGLYPNGETWWDKGTKGMSCPYSRQ